MSEPRVVIEQMKKQIRRLDCVVDDRAYILLTYQVNDSPIAMVELRQMSERSTSFFKLFVAESARRQYIGSLLVDECCRIAFQEFKTDTVGITCLDTPELIAFYRRCGFRMAYQYETGGEVMMVR